MAENARLEEMLERAMQREEGRARVQAERMAKVQEMREQRADAAAAVQRQAQEKEKKAENKLRFRALSRPMQSERELVSKHLTQDMHRRIQGACPVSSSKMTRRMR
eukprot:4645969-Pyramimonas_sp.AAC.1